MATNEVRRLHFLDSLRGLAAVYVVFFHAHLAPHPNPTIDNWLAERFVDFGGTGVILFFLISGFSLSLTMGRHDRTGFPALSYGISRFFRIAPLFYFILLAVIAQAVLLFNQPTGVKSVILDASFLFNFFPDKQEGIVPASWTIGVEMLFYAIFLPLYRSSARFQIAACIAALAVLEIERNVLPPTYTYFSFVGFVPLFQLGMWSHRLYNQLCASQNRPAAWAMLASGIALLTACALIPHAPLNVFVRYPIGIAYGLILVSCGVLSPSLLSSPILTFYGKISYSLYLAHPLVIVALAGAFPVIAGIFPGDLAYWMGALLALSATTFVAWLLFLAIERPGIQFGKVAYRRAAALLAERAVRRSTNPQGAGLG